MSIGQFENEVSKVIPPKDIGIKGDYIDHVATSNAWNQFRDNLV